MLTASERLDVEAAVRRAEATTAGEIVVVATRQAGRYRSVPLVYGLATALLSPWPLLLWSDLSVTRIVVAQLALTLAALLVTAPARYRACLAPPAWRRARAREAAAREFVARGMADTRGRTGVLLFVAEAERYAEVVGDVGIAGRVDEADWRAVIDRLVPALADGRRGAGLAAAVAAIGDILARHVPPGEADTDELPNRVVVL